MKGMDHTVLQGKASVAACHPQSFAYVPGLEKMRSNEDVQNDLRSQLAEGYLNLSANAPRLCILGLFHPTSSSRRRRQILTLCYTPRQSGKITPYQMAISVEGT
jgi:hypothetical protein